ncbi:peptidyl-tRNA hydrolase [Candidatus Bathyarchaeota archaeon]|nr:MAG: peptidyl-tRNA hydrolase [Candidatus Bathyarchaeota archaeon]
MRIINKQSVKEGSESISRYKQVILLRSDLNMSCGKAAAQACHASLMASEEARRTQPSWWRAWMKEGQRKIVLKVSSEREILKKEREAKEAGIPSALISDMGLTELPPETITALGIGPAPERVIDKITGSLPLY